MIQPLVLRHLNSSDTQIRVPVLTSGVRLLWYACPDPRVAEPCRALLTSKSLGLQVDHSRKLLRTTNWLQIRDQVPKSLPRYAILSYIHQDMPASSLGRAVSLFTNDNQCRSCRQLFPSLGSHPATHYARNTPLSTAIPMCSCCRL